MQIDQLIQQVFTDNGIDVKYKDSGEIKYRCPFHESSNNQSHNASISRNSGKWCCYSGDCGVSGSSIFFFYAMLKNVDVRVARQEIKTKYGYDEGDQVFEKRKVTIDDQTFVERKLPYGFKKIPSDHPHVVEEGLDIQTLRSLKVGVIDEKSIIIPFMKEGVCWGWASKILGGKYIYNFSKKHFLYAFEQALCSKKVVIVEGLRDVWRLRGFGINAVAISGSRVSKPQVNMILSNWKDVILCLDGNSAGQEGMDDLYRQLNGLVDVKVIQLPAEKEFDDPCKLRDIEYWRNVKVQNGASWYERRTSKVECPF